MTHREQLRDNVEDALFAMWMDDFARQRGEELMEENERLKKDPAAAVPPRLRRRNLDLIARELRRNARSFTLRSAGRAALRLAAAAIVLLALFGCAYAAFPEFRTGTLNLLMELDSRAASFRLADESSAQTPSLLPSVRVDWLPEGYKGGNPVDDRLQTTIDCTNEVGDLIRVRVFTENKTSYSLDIEEAASWEELTIQGHPALLIQKDSLYRIGWADDAINVYAYVESDAIDRDTLIQVAESVSILR